MPHKPLDGSTGNRLIDRLPKADSSQLIASGRHIAFQQGDVVHRQGSPMTDVLFPTHGCCCQIVTLDEGRPVETVTIGNEGMVGYHLTLGLDWSPLTVVALVPGEALRVPTTAFLDVMKNSDVLENLVRRYAAFCLRFESQIVACNALHSIEQRACRRMLMAHDRVDNAEFSLAQELLSEMLGVRRQSVAAIAGTLQAAKVIAYRRGVIKIIDRRGLEAASCQCYQVIKTAYESIVMN
jgi:CRP-like cAMP-binding protein